MVGFTVPAIFFWLTAFVQLTLGFVVIIRRPRVEWAVVLGLLFLFNGASSVNTALVNMGVAMFKGGALTNGPDVVFLLTDRATTYLIAYLALAYPRRPRFAADRPWLLPTLIGAAYLIAVGGSLAGIPTGQGIAPGQETMGCIATATNACGAHTLFYRLIYDGFSIGFILLLLRWSPMVARTTSPLELQQFRLIAGAFFMRAAHVGLLFGFTFLVPFLLHPDKWAAWTTADPGLWIDVAKAAVDVAAIGVAVALLLRSRVKAGSEVRATLDILIGMIAAGVLLFAIESANGTLSGAAFAITLGILPQLDVAVVRPVFVTFAMARYGLLGTLRRPRPLVQGLVVAFGSFAFVPGIYGQLIDLGSQDLVALIGGLLVGTAVSAGLAFLLTPYVLPRATSQQASAAVQAYVGLLEDAYRNRDIGERRRASLDADRLRLGVSEAQGQALEDAVRTRWSTGTRSERDWRPGDRILGRYHIDRLLGEGGSAEAFLARDDLDGVNVVLKRTRHLDASSRRTLLAEAHALGRLDHPNIVKLLRTEVVGDEPVLVLEHLRGGSLATRLAEHGPLSRKEAVRVIGQVLAALQWAHAAGVVHRDLKPSNVIFDGRGDAHLCDFGLARPLQSGQLGDPTATSDHPAGTLRYMSPEQVQGFPPSERSDLYSVAMLLYECLTGQNPVPPRLNDYDMRQWIVEGPAILPPKDWPKPLQEFVQRGLSRDPATRFGSAVVMAAALSAAV